MNNKLVGITGEEDAREYLEQKGYTVLYKNKKIAGVEIDIVLKKGDLLVFCEVKSRDSDKYGRGIEAIDRERMKRYIRAGKSFTADKKYRDYSLRFDVIEIMRGKIEHIEDAFRA
jgi:putative endonuclease